MVAPKDMGATMEGVVRSFLPIASSWLRGSVLESTQTETGPRLGPLLLLPQPWERSLLAYSMSLSLPIVENRNNIPSSVVIKVK